PSSAVSSFSRRLSFTAPPPTQTSTLSLHDALPISPRRPPPRASCGLPRPCRLACRRESRVFPPGRLASGRIRCDLCAPTARLVRSEENTSELQSLTNLVCRLLLEKKKTQHSITTSC